MLEENCLLCFKTVALTASENCPSTIEKELFSYFTLDKLLQISKSTSIRLLENHGNPSTWFNVCKACEEKIIQVRVLFNELIHLQFQWENIKASVKNKIISCHQDDLFKQSDRKLSTSAAIICTDILKGRVKTFATLNCEPDPTNSDLLDSSVVKVEEDESLSMYDEEMDYSFSETFTQNKSPNEDASSNMKSKKTRRKLLPSISIKNENIFEGEDTTCRNSELEKDGSVQKFSRRGRLIKSRIQYESDINSSDNECAVSSQSNIEESRSDSDFGVSLEADKAFDESVLTIPEKLDKEVENYKKRRKRRTETEYECRICENLKFKNGQLLKSHVKDNHKDVEKPYICECGGKYPKLSLLQGHKLYVHNTNNSASAFNCSVCKMLFKSEKGLHIHLSTIHGNKPHHECSFCGKTFKSKFNLLQHESVVHRKERNYICEHCNEPFKNKTDLKYHQMSKHKVIFENSSVVVNCEQCGKILSTPGSLKKHVDRVHEKKYNFFCPICNLGCYSKFLMKKHIMIAHTNNRSELCQYCGKGFTSKDKLTDHLRTHTGEKPFQCEVCGKAFHAKKHLVSHKKIHAGGSFQCEICSKTYATQEYMKHHIWYVHRKQQSSRLPNQKQIVDTKVLETVAQSAGLTFKGLKAADAPS